MPLEQKGMMIGDLATASAIKFLGELGRDCSLNKCYKAFSTERLVQKQQVKGQPFPLEKYPSQPSGYYCLLSQSPAPKRGGGLGEVKETKMTVIKRDSGTSGSQDDKAIQTAVPCHREGNIWKVPAVTVCLYHSLVSKQMWAEDESSLWVCVS